MKKILFILIAVLFFSGCATQSTLVKKNQPVSKEKGVILASVTKKGGTDVWFYYRKEGDEHEKRMDAVGFSMFIAPDDYPDNKDKNGRLLAFEADEGKYYLTRWEIYAYLGTGYKYIGPRDPKPLPFSVKAGQVTYLGNLHVETIHGKNFLGLPIPVSGVSSIENQEEIDIKLLEEKYPNISNWPVKVEIPDRSLWDI